ncbi:MAG TPA: ATP synthase F0 subunit B [Candidatus Binatia bacterium]|nr:ATP synthase F0 subunit B [Candidatus Binatia bacterium]
MSDAQFYIKLALWSQVVSSAVFIAALLYVWFRWIVPVVMAAQERSNRQIAEAERRRDEVKGALETLRREIEGAHHDAKLIEARAEERGDHERQALIDEATAAGERALQDAGRELERGRAAARTLLRDELFERALALARADAARTVDRALDARLVERCVGSLERAAHG